MTPEPDYARDEKERQRLMNVIIQQEKSIFRKHKNFIEEMISINETDQSILVEAEKPGSDIPSYLEQMEYLLQKR